ncbi:hypothetical protein GCM10027516_14100 [Niabella aquatica]
MPFLADSQTIRYIKADGTGDGSSWNNASGDLQAMINASAANDQVWVARGTYYPSATNNRDAFFNIRKNNVRLYGGFSGTETNVTQRNVSANPTILSGDIGTPGNNNDNSYHIMVIELDPENPQPIDNSTLVDGFTFSDGNASAGSVYNNLYPRYTGSAIFITCNFNSVNITPAIQNCTFINNNAFSSGAVSYEGIAAPGNSCQFINCMFQNNYAGYSGAAIDILQLDAAGYGVPGDFSVKVAGCTFLENIVDNSLQGGANGGTGGGINIFGTGTLWVSNSKFINNRIGTGTLYAGTYKGTAVAIRNGTDATIVNSLAYASNNDVPFYNQQSSLKLVGSTLYNPGSTVLDLNAPAVTSIQNSIVWTDGSTANVINVSSGTAAITISSSVINANYQGTATLSNVLNSNPLFINSAGGDFTLQPGSPAINAGDKTLYNAATMGGADLAGNARIAENIIDMGAYEANSTPLPVIFGSTAAVIKNNRLTVQWQTESETNNSYFEIEGSANGRDFIKIGKVQSKAKDGNSSTTLQYEYSINVNAAAALLGASLLLALCIPAFGGKRKWRIACIICSAGLVLYSCAKNETVVDTAGNKIFLRIAQVDKDGTKDYSKAVLVVRE